MTESNTSQDNNSMPEMREWRRKALYFRAVWSRQNSFWKVYYKTNPSPTADYHYDCTVRPSEGLTATCDQINEEVKKADDPPIRPKRGF